MADVIRLIPCVAREAEARGEADGVVPSVPRGVQAEHEGHALHLPREADGLILSSLRVRIEARIGRVFELPVRERPGVPQRAFRRREGGNQLPVPLETPVRRVKAQDEAALELPAAGIAERRVEFAGLKALGHEKSALCAVARGLRGVLGEVVVVKHAGRGGVLVRIALRHAGLLPYEVEVELVHVAYVRPLAAAHPEEHDEPRALSHPNVGRARAAVPIKLALGLERYLVVNRVKSQLTVR